MGRTWDKHWRKGNACRSLVRTLERNWRRWKDYIEMGLNEMA
jgi:hypothetical protein